MELSLDGLASHVVIAHFCDSRSASGVGGQSSDYANPAVTAPGEHLADYVLLYQDGTTAAIPVRRRFEVNQISTFLQNAFVARQQHEPRALDLHGPYDADLWGRTQMGVVVGGLARWSVAPHWLGDDLSPRASWSIYAMPNPHRGRAIAGLRIVSTGVASIGIGAITLFYGVGHPLRHLPLESVSVELSDGVLTDDDAARSQIDLGVIARRYRQPVFDASAWLRAPVRGWGEKWESGSTERSGLVLDLSGAEDAALTVAGREVALADLYGSGEASSTDGRLTARLIMPDKAWMEVTVIDKATGKPTPSPVHFRAPDGHYLPPVGHRQEVNDNWFEDYGADLKLGQTQYAYAGGQFQIQLPEGEVFVEVSKGFEFEPLRTRLNLSRGQREVRIELDRIADSRQEGWITADTHVHFLSPETARLEAQAEGLNIVNLLAAQWGDLYTNVGDLTGAQSGVSVDETIVWVGTENRQHFLGHISMLGVQGNPVLPLSTSGPPEGYIGEPTLRAMGEWADECRSKSGLVIAPHFPLPHSEITAEIVRGRVDAVELRDWHGSTMSTFGVDEWYRHLNAGYRVAAVGGTDKMSAGMPVGGVRTSGSEPDYTSTRTITCPRVTGSTEIGHGAASTPSMRLR